MKTLQSFNHKALFLKILFTQHLFSACHILGITLGTQGAVSSRRDTILGQWYVA